MKAYKRPEKRLERVPKGQGGHEQDWVRACKDGKSASSTFDYGGPLTEMVLLGVLAMRMKDRRLELTFFSYDHPQRFEPAHASVHAQRTFGDVDLDAWCLRSDLGIRQPSQAFEVRNQRGDGGEQFSYLPELDHAVWLADPDWRLEELADRLQTYQRDCRRLLELDRGLQAGLAELHAGGLTKYQYSDTPDRELQAIIGFSHQLQQEKQALEKKARSSQ